MWKFPKYELFSRYNVAFPIVNGKTWEYGLDSDFKKVKFPKVSKFLIVAEHPLL